MHPATALKHAARTVIFSIPGAQRAVIKLLAKPRFSGWGMSTAAHSPWLDGGDFNDTAAALYCAVSSGEFRLTQFEREGIQQAMLRELMWRHYFVYWTAEYAAAHSRGDLVECGVCDGMSVFFALSATDDRRAFLYDGWDAVPAGQLAETEMNWAGKYEHLKMETTQRNLQRFANRCIFNKGFIPEVLSTARNPDSVSWLHIDLNAAGPTVDALDYFHPRMSQGGVIVFDDYGHPGFEDTLHAVNLWAASKNGKLMAMPTGQGVFFVG